MVGEMFFPFVAVVTIVTLVTVVSVVSFVSLVADIAGESKGRPQGLTWGGGWWKRASEAEGNERIPVPQRGFPQAAPPRSTPPLPLQASKDVPKHLPVEGS